MPRIKAIETVYNGYRFRSRLEARWAVFFDAMGFEYQYEPEGFEFDNGLKYLPDFWLPRVEMYGEVKPTPLTGTDREKVASLVIATGKKCLQLIGPPDFKPYWAVERASDWTEEDYRKSFTLGTMQWDYALVSQYYYTENRFFNSCAGLYEQESDFAWDKNYIDAVHAARGARFEHGEEPLT
ncbi:MAG: hypothetical protein GWN93_06725 [Deltaproteobacteria bacterium]|nr:hypothetical protein [Deltaproteobacteria bacterium]